MDIGQQNKEEVEHLTSYPPSTVLSSTQKREGAVQLMDLQSTTVKLGHRHSKRPDNSVLTQHDPVQRSTVVLASDSEGIH